MAFNPIGSLSGWLGQQAGGVPGTGGYDPSVNGDAAINPNVVPVPGAPGLFIDQSTGQIITADAAGRASNSVAQAPNANVLTTQDTANGGALRGVQTGALGQLGSTIAGENRAIGAFDNTINNPNAPSAAKSQFATGLSALTGQQEGLAAGATGENRNGANRIMAQNIAGMGAAANGTAALTRANEVANAEAGQAGMLGAQGNQLGNLFTAAGNQALGYAGDATKNQDAIVDANTSNSQFNAKQDSNLLSNLGGGIGQLAALL